MNNTIYLSRDEFKQAKNNLNSAEYWTHTEFSDHSCADFWANLSSIHGSEDQLRIFDKNERIVAILAYCQRFPKD